MTFEKIDAERRRQNRTVRELCRSSGVAYSTYWFAVKRRNIMRRRTLERLAAALARAPLPDGRRKRANSPASGGDVEMRNLLLMNFRAYVRKFAPAFGLGPDLVLAADPSLRWNVNDEWALAAKVRALAVCCVLTEFGVTGAQVGRAIGVSRQAVSDMVRRVQDMRDDPKIDEMIERVSAEIVWRPE